MFLNNVIFHFYVGGSGDSHVQAQILTSKRMSSSAFLTNNKCQTNTGVGGQVLQGPDHQPWAWLKLYILIIFSVFRDSFFIMVSRRLGGGVNQFWQMSKLTGYFLKASLRMQMMHHYDSTKLWWPIILKLFQWVSIFIVL